MNIEVKAVRTNKELKKFIKFPWEVYKDYPNWVPPLISEEKKHYNRTVNPFFKYGKAEYFLAYKNGKIVGRISAINNPNHNKEWNEKVGFFGSFECIDDKDVAKALFDKAKEWVKAEGMDTLRGPMTFTTNDPFGLLIEGFEYKPVFMMNYHPPYYQKLVEEYGFEKAKDVYSYKRPVTEPINEKVVKIANITKKRYGYKLRKIDLSKAREEINNYKIIYNSAWEKNWGFVKLTEEEIEYVADDFKKIIDPDLMQFVEVDGRPVALMMVLPNLNEGMEKANGRLFPFGFIHMLRAIKKPRWVRLITTGIIEEYRGKGIDALLYTTMVMEGQKKKYLEWCDISWQLEDNFLIIKAIETMGGEKYKVHRVYDLSI